MVLVFGYCFIFYCKFCLCLQISTCAEHLSYAYSSAFSCAFQLQHSTGAQKLESESMQIVIWFSWFLVFGYWLLLVCFVVSFALSFVSLRYIIPSPRPGSQLPTI
jgi:uncharacterized membrane protein YccF (DUF307 family)